MTIHGKVKSKKFYKMKAVAWLSDDIDQNEYLTVETTVTFLLQQNDKSS